MRGGIFVAGEHGQMAPVNNSTRHSQETKHLKTHLLLLNCKKLCRDSVSNVLVFLNRVGRF